MTVKNAKGCDRKLFDGIDLTKEIPTDQKWVYNEDFEKAIYSEDACFKEAKAITFGPDYHWFGYYDKFQTDPTDRFVLSMKIGFDDRSPRADDELVVGMVDTEDNNKWHGLGKSISWCWQQGCMLQWRPYSDDEVIWNHRIRDKFVSCILDISTGEKKIVDYPVFHVNPDGKSALVMDMPRLQFLRPGYGYPGIPDKNADVLVPDDSYISVLDVDSGQIDNIISVARIAAIDYPDRNLDDDIHYFNGPTWSPDGQRFLFVNRWRSKTGRFPDFRTRMFSAAADGSDVRLVTDKPWISHCTWRDNQHITMWREDGYKIFKDDGSGAETDLLNATNGHVLYLPGNKYMMADTYHDREGYQNLFFFEVATGRIISVGRFFTPEKYRGGERRCDLHARIHRSGKRLCVDSTHGNNGRQLYLIDIEDLID
jgi:hypothetical protein